MIQTQESLQLIDKSMTLRHIHKSSLKSLAPYYLSLYGSVSRLFDSKMAHNHTITTLHHPFPSSYNPRHPLLCNLVFFEPFNDILLFLLYRFIIWRLSCIIGDTEIGRKLT